VQRARLLCPEVVDELSVGADELALRDVRCGRGVVLADGVVVDAGLGGGEADAGGDEGDRQGDYQERER
jgi:hypothetical protein